MNSATPELSASEQRAVPSKAAAALIAALCSGALLWLFWSAAAWAPQFDWNAARLYPAYLVAAGEPLYPRLGEAVPNGWIHGPALPLVLVPFTWIPNPTAALVAAAWFNIGVLVGPFLAGLRLGCPRASSTPWTARLFFFCAATALLLFLPTTGHRLIFLTSDSLAIGLGLASCLALHRATLSPEWWRVSLAAALATAAVGTKQTEAALPLAQLAFLAWRERRIFWRYFLALAVLHGIAAAGAIAAFGADGLWFNLYTIPSRHPWESGWNSVARNAGLLLLYTAPLALVCGGAARRAKNDPLARPRLRCAGLLLFAAAGLFPLNVLAASKQGSFENSFHALYFCALAALVALDLPAWFARRTADRQMIAAAMLTLSAVWFIQRMVPLRLAPDPTLSHAIELARAHPQEILFPQNPLVTWLTEHRRYQFESAVDDLVFAGFLPQREKFLHGLPPRLRYVAYPARWPERYILKLLPPVKTTAPHGEFTVLELHEAPD